MMQSYKKFKLILVCKKEIHRNPLTPPPFPPTKEKRIYSCLENEYKTHERNILYIVHSGQSLWFLFFFCLFYGLCTGNE